MTHADSLGDDRVLQLSSDLRYEPFEPLSASVRVDIGARSHRGARTSNEDHYLVVRLGRHQETLATSLPEGQVPARFDEAAYGMVLADGMGLTGSGEVASRLAIATLAHLVLHFGKWNVRIDQATADEVLQRARRFYEHVDLRVADAATAHPTLTGMGTTLTAAYSAGDMLFVAHVGHSRAYLLRDGLLTQLTRDQTLAQQLNDTGSGLMELAAHDLGHILSDAIGGYAGGPHVQIRQWRLVHGDSLLLCTNGLTDVVPDEVCTGLLARADTPDAACAALIDEAMVRGATDNVSVIVGRYSMADG